MLAELSWHWDHNLVRIASSHGDHWGQDLHHSIRAWRKGSGRDRKLAAKGVHTIDEITNLKNPVHSFRWLDDRFTVFFGGNLRIQNEPELRGRYTDRGFWKMGTLQFLNGG